MFPRGSHFKLCQATFPHRGPIFVFFTTDPNTLRRPATLSWDEWKRELRPWLLRLFLLGQPAHSFFHWVDGCAHEHWARVVHLWACSRRRAAPALNTRASTEEKLLNPPSPQVAEAHFSASGPTKLRKSVLKRNKKTPTFKTCELAKCST